MGEIRLTRDADALICVLYKSYLEDRKAGMSRADARFFEGSNYIQRELMPKHSSPF